MWLPSIQGPRGFVSTPAPGFWARLVFLTPPPLRSSKVPVLGLWRTVLDCKSHCTPDPKQLCRFGDTVKSAKLKKNQRLIDC